MITMFRLRNIMRMLEMRARTQYVLRQLPLFLLVILSVVFLLQRLPPKNEDSVLFAEYQQKHHALRDSIEEDDLENVNRDKPWYMRDGLLWPSEYLIDWEDQKLFPEDSPNDDRITNQLMFLVLEEHEIAPVKTIFIKSGQRPDNQWMVKKGTSEFAECPVDRCSLTVNPSEATTADAILFNNLDTIDEFTRPLNQIWILMLLESAGVTKPLHLPVDAFNWTASYRRDSDLVMPVKKWQYYYPGINDNGFDRNMVKSKQKKVAWIITECKSTDHRNIIYATELARHIEVDIYGKCRGYAQCPKADPNCLEMLKEHYKFVLTFENTNCMDYITEKFYDALEHNVIPIAMGARSSDYIAVAPEHSYIHVEDYKDAAELARYLHLLDQNTTLYSKYFNWQATGEFVNTHFFCRLCALLHANDQRRRRGHYTDVHAWWTQDACSDKDWRLNRNNYLRVTHSPLDYINDTRK